MISGEVRPYLDRLAGRLSETLSNRLLGVYVVGSIALGDYRPGRSDIDVYAVLTAGLSQEEKLLVAQRCSHRALPCPARKLELVVITAAAAQRPSRLPRWELNFNTGASQHDHVGLDPEAEPGHWFVVDLALAHDRGIALTGLPAREAIGPPDTNTVRDAQAETVAWYARQQMDAETIMAACRAWHWRQTGTFAAKREALRWAMTQLDH